MVRRTRGFHLLERSQPLFSLPAHHPCTQTCHAPTACPETEPCLAPVTLTCPCGHLRSTVPCSGTKLVLACTGECEIKKRNARLAEALGISEEKREARGGVSWSSEMVGCARVLGSRFIGVVEKAFAECVFSSCRCIVGVELMVFWGATVSSPRTERRRCCRICQLTDASLYTTYVPFFPAPFCRADLVTMAT